MTREEAIKLIEHVSIVFMPTDQYGDYDDPQPYEDAFDMAIEALQEVQKHEKTFEWCHDCKEYDTDNHCCHRWSQVIRNTVEELKTDRPQGEWIRLIEYVPESNESLINFDGYQCSVCGGKLWADSFNFWNCCPMCGARMKDGAV